MDADIKTSEPQYTPEQVEFLNHELQLKKAIERLHTAVNEANKVLEQIKNAKKND